ncbi:NAD(P)-dependent dehydrogenase, short-chain alcohol dehydrogenase family [Abditibacterium utsteinense]|uniref:NAD(P)-dependent dehydrogenase, short-chain alcohol dehydrogenase family n=1 Tax=Abditibacterium utsteinense TaxID=1960156 RepID=A0A2S8SWX4_9BACT|nr:SDR family oxidoreductase [Abditibacterium utsteinense]PQV65303.1 NAD(P)-dependent dehydrogenase, short-chain alcohol dehydrogenase family [Abditibacterium utsteinense]
MKFSTKNEALTSFYDEASASFNTQIMKKIALITGANRGLGLEAARQLAAQNFTVILGSRDLAKGEEAAARLRETGADAHAVQLEVTDEASVKAAARDIEAKFGHLDALINNAGVYSEYANTHFSPSQLSSEELRQTYETNFFGALSVLQTFLPLLQKSEAPRVVNVSSSLGSLELQSNPDSPYYGLNTLAYGSSKAALNSLTIAFAKEFKDTNLKINSACPGWVKTDLGSDAAPRELEEGPRIFVTLATLPNDGPSGQFFDENGLINW